MALNSGFPINEYNRINGGIGYRHNTISEISAYEQALRFYNIYRDDDPNADLSFDNFELSLGWYRSTLLQQWHFPNRRLVSAFER